MAIQQPPPAPPGTAAPQQAAAPPKAKKSGCFGCGCGGCLLVVILIALLIGGGGYWFFVVQASAAVTAPATLILFNQPVTVNNNPGTPGEALNANDTVATQGGGHASIQFPDGSFIRMAPQTTVQIQSIQLQKGGNVQAVEALQKTGRTLVNVQHLANGATFKVNGHSVSATVRGTQFEMLVRPNGTILIKVFEGTVRVSGKTTVDVTAGNEIEVDANGNLSAVRPIQRDPQDPYPMATQCSKAVSNGTTAGTAQTTTGDPISTGQAAEVDYDSPGGAVSVALCYPGSMMTLSVFDPNGVEHATRNSASPVQSNLNGPAGRYRAIVHAVNVSPAEAFVISFATSAPCEAGNIDSAGVVRETLSTSQIATALAESGTSGVTIYVQGTSPTSARIVYYSDVGGTQLSWTIDFYAATPNLGAVITQVTVHGINVTTQVITNLSSFGGHSISSIPSGFVVDRVYSCATLTGDNLMVVEGHR